MEGIARFITYYLLHNEICLVSLIVINYRDEER